MLIGFICTIINLKLSAKLIRLKGNIVHVDMNRLNVNTLYIILHVDEFYRVCWEKVCHHIISYHPYHYHCYYYMFIILSRLPRYHPWYKFFMYMYHCCDVTMDYKMTLGTACKRLHKIYVKMKMVP